MPRNFFAVRLNPAILQSSNHRIQEIATAVHFFLELAAILLTCRVVGLLSQRLGQPQVVGEMVAGVLLGPSLLGRLAPDIQHHLFPPGPSNVVLYTAAQIGLVLYMFLIGLNFDVNLIKHRVGTAAAVSAAGIFTPLALGATIAVPLLAGRIYFDKSVTLIMAMMFLGASIATTAFPMLARIIYERGLSGTPLGTLALACGATDDALSWCILATVLAIHRGSLAVAVTAIVGGILYTLLLLTIGRKALRVLGTVSERRNTITAPVLSTGAVIAFRRSDIVPRTRKALRPSVKSSNVYRIPPPIAMAATATLPRCMASTVARMHQDSASSVAPHANASVPNGVPESPRS